jgi:hypothetical protein
LTQWPCGLNDVVCKIGHDARVVQSIFYSLEKE